MTNEEMIREIASLPEDVKFRIERIIEAYRERAGRSAKTADRPPLEQEPFFGMWADREDMADPLEWVRNQRRTQWDRSDGWEK